MMVVAGATVNPLEKGTGAVYNHPVSAKIQEIAGEDSEARWLCVDTFFTLSNFCLANGARVLDATNFYPDADKWQLLDPDGIYEKSTNRYANQSCFLTDGMQSSIDSNKKHPDSITWYLCCDDLKKLDIRYLFAGSDYTELLASHGIAAEKLFEQSGYAIYSLSY